MSRAATNDTAKQAVLPLWGSAANAFAVYRASTQRFCELAVSFVNADTDRNEAKMSEVVSEMRSIVRRIERFKRAQFQKWAKEREAQRR